jgi:hypothetical protein
MNEASHGSSGEEVEMSGLSRTILIVGPERLLWFFLGNINSKVLSHSPCFFSPLQV